MSKYNTDSVCWFLCQCVNATTGLLKFFPPFLCLAKKDTLLNIVNLQYLLTW